MMKNTLCETLKMLECELHHAGQLACRARVQQLLHPAFYEVGRSGQIYNRDTVVNFLGSLERADDAVADQFAVTGLGDDCALLTYRSANRDAQGQLYRFTLRSSVWRFSNGQWQLFYHQGTAAACHW